MRESEKSVRVCRTEDARWAINLLLRACDVMVLMFGHCHRLEL